MSRPGASIYDVAERAGVSIATVSRVLGDSVKVAPLTRERVLAAAEELRWRPSTLARGLAARQHGAVGIVFPDLSGHYYAQVVLGYEERAVAGDRSVLILATHGKASSGEVVLDLADRVDGLVVMDRTVPDTCVRELETAGMPVVLLARSRVGGTPTVRTENARAARLLVGHLLAHGHRRLAFLGDPEAAPDVHQRWRGFVRAHRDAALPAAAKPVQSGFLTDDGYAAAALLLDAADRPTALVCANDEIALGAIRAARELGLHVPGDLAITGWDDNPAAGAVTPPLTTVRQPMRELGRAAGDLLTARMAGNPSVASKTLPTELVIRRSCGCPNEEVPR